MAYSEHGGGVSSHGRSTLLVDEIVNSDRGYARGPERALLSALLFDGVQSFMSFVAAGQPDKGGRYKEAFGWVTRRGGDYVFSFDAVCEALGVDPEFLRLGLLNACNCADHEWKKARRNF
jgi:hypothetical protein